MRLLVTGAAGMLGTDVVAAAIAADHEVLGLSRAQLDITDAEAVAEAVEEAGPDAVINCAAYTAVDAAESDQDAAAAINAVGAGNVAKAADRIGAWTVHVSSDYVFDGTKTTPYVESDRTRPQSVYGATKLLGEQEVALKSRSRHTIVRTSWLFGNAGPCFPATILRLASERDTLKVVEDQIGCPTFTGHLAPVLVALGTVNCIPGVMHLAASEECSWFEFALEILAGAGARATVEACTTDEFPRPAERPAYSVLRSERLEAPILPDWHVGLEAYLSARAVA
jgi:dTDP-4-dehydrorhamnose reductase